jgi:hypothetical protein
VVAIGDTPDEVERALGGLRPTVRAGSMDDAVRAATSSPSRVTRSCCRPRARRSTGTTATSSAATTSSAQSRAPGSWDQVSTTADRIPGSEASGASRHRRG